MSTRRAVQSQASPCGKRRPPFSRALRPNARSPDAGSSPAAPNRPDARQTGRQGRMSAPFLVVGRTGELATDLVEAASRLNKPLVALGRPDLDLTSADSIARAVD